MEDGASNALRAPRVAWLRPLLLIAAAYLLAILIAFREPLFSGFDLGFGDRGDAIIEISILEHWRNVFAGVEAWNQTLYFHPHGGTLGFNDGYLLHGLIYSGWRTAFDPFVSDTLTAFTLQTIGFAGCIFLVARVLRWGSGTAALIALIFTISNNVYVGAVHAQIRSLALLPLLAALIVLAYRAEIGGQLWRARGYALAAVAVLGLWLITAYYFAWFTLFFTLVLLLCWAFVTGNLNPRGLAVLRGHWGTLLIAGAAFCLVALPFLSVYLPKAIETGGQGYKLSYLVHPSDLINVGPANLVWGWLIAGFRILFGNGALAETIFGGEHESGFPLIFFALVCAAIWPLARRRGDASFLRVFALAILISWALTLRIGPVSPWLLVNWIVPGAQGLRVVLRYQLFLVLPLLLLLAAVYRDRLAAMFRDSPVLAAILVALLVLEQVNLGPSAELSRREQTAALETLPPPPPACTSFYTVAVRGSEPTFVDARHHGLYPHNVDAMYLAERWRVPTINGFSTFNPYDWDFAEPRLPDYAVRVASYARRHGLVPGLCGLDVRKSPVWTRLTPAGDQTRSE